MSRVLCDSKSGRQLSLSAASTAAYARLSKWVLTAATICLPAEKPMTHLVRIDLPFSGVQAYQPDRSLRILQCRR